MIARQADPDELTARKALEDVRPNLADTKAILGPAFWGAWQPDERQTVSEWADTHRVLTTNESNEAGQWRTSRTPYLREILDCWNDPGVPEVAFVKGSQVGGTEVLLNLVGYIADRAPGPTMLVTGDLKLAKEISQNRIDRMVESSERLRERFVDDKARDSGNTIGQKNFEGGFLKIVGANAPGSLRSTPIRYLLQDELSVWKGSIGDEGDPQELARRGTRTFGSRKKVFSVSTPGIEGRCRITMLWERSDKRYFEVPCPDCSLPFVFRWELLRFDHDYTDPRMACPACGSMLEEHHKTAMMAQGQWVATEPDGEIRGYHLSALYSPLGMYSWREAVREFRAATKPVKNVEKLQVWTNQTLGEPWRDKESPPKWQVLYHRREQYGMGTVPPGPVILTAGADVQKDRIEYEVVGWGEGLESWSIDYGVIPGSPETRDPWEGLERLLAQRFHQESTGVDFTVACLAVDSGYETQHVYRWVRGQMADRVIAVKGSDSLEVPVGIPSSAEVSRGGKRIQRGIRVWPVGVSKLKSELYGWLKLEQPIEPDAGYPPGYCHYPEHDPEWFKQLTSEALERRYRRGRQIVLWTKVRDRNEALDCRVYARAASIVKQLDRWPPEEWVRVRDSIRGYPAPSPAPKSEKRTAKRFSRWRSHKKT